MSSNLPAKNTEIQKHKTIILPVVLYRCETLSLALREERRVKVFENRVLRNNWEGRNNGRVERIT
jgi:hypothetical protein